MWAYRLIKILVPIGVAIDMMHSFYYVGCMIKENMERIEEKKRRELAVAVGTVLCKVGKSCRSTDFWPASISSNLESVVLPSLVLPPPSYEDLTMEKTIFHKVALLMHMLKNPTFLGHRPTLADGQQTEIRPLSSDTPPDQLDQAFRLEMQGAAAIVEEFDGRERDGNGNGKDVLVEPEDEDNRDAEGNFDEDRGLHSAGLEELEGFEGFDMDHSASMDAEQN